MVDASSDRKNKTVIKTAQPPMGLALYGRANPANVSYIGWTNHSSGTYERRLLFGLHRADRRKHAYIVGKPSTGKTKLLELLTRQDIGHGYGCAIFDPYGDLIEATLGFVPEARIKKTVVIDPLQTDWTLGFNPLSDVPSYFYHDFVEIFTDTIKLQLQDYWSPAIEYILRQVILALLEHPESSMADAIPLLQDADFRSNFVAKLATPELQSFWQTGFTAWAAQHETTAILPVVNRLERFVQHPLLADTLSQTKNKLDFSAFVKHRYAVLINLAKGQLGEYNAQLFGALLMARFKLAGYERAEEVDNRLKTDFLIYIDDFYWFAGEHLEHMLVEARRYGFIFTLSHQYSNKIDANTYQALIGNIGNIFAFRLATEDAQRLKSEFLPTFDTRDLTMLGNRQFYTKMTVSGDLREPFSAETLDVLPAPTNSSDEAILTHVRKTYSA